LLSIGYIASSLNSSIKLLLYKKCKSHFNNPNHVHWTVNEISVAETILYCLVHFNLIKKFHKLVWRHNLVVLPKEKIRSCHCEYYNMQSSQFKCVVLWFQPGAFVYLSSKCNIQRSRLLLIPHGLLWCSQIQVKPLKLHILCLNI